MLKCKKENKFKNFEGCFVYKKNVKLGYSLSDPFLNLRGAKSYRWKNISLYKKTINFVGFVIRLDHFWIFK